METDTAYPLPSLTSGHAPIPWHEGQRVIDVIEGLGYFPIRGSKLRGHILRPDLGGQTVCGLYNIFDDRIQGRIPDEADDMPRGATVCGRCEMFKTRPWAYPESVSA